MSDRVKSDIEFQRELLQCLYTNRYKQPVYMKDAGYDITSDQYQFNVAVLEKGEWIRNVGAGNDMLELLPKAVQVVQDPADFEATFPLRYDIPRHTAQLVQTLEGLLKGRYDAALQQFLKAKKFLYDTSPPDYLNCIKEAAGAVEGFSRVLLQNPKETLGKLLDPLAKKYFGHPAMRKILDGVNAVRGDEPGVAHGAYEPSKLGFADAEFILNTSAAILVYLAKKGPVNS
jgi:hypothetical protein